MQLSFCLPFQLRARQDRWGGREDEQNEREQKTPAYTRVIIPDILKTPDAKPPARTSVFPYL